MSGGGQCHFVLAMVLVNMAFGLANVLLKKIVDGGVNHMAIVAYRQSIASILLAPFAYYWERKSRPRLTGPILGYLFLSALLGLTLTMYLFLMGLEYTSATYSCAFVNTVPVNTFIIALTFGLEKMNLRGKAGRAKLVGVLICMSGVISLLLYKGIPLNNTHLLATQADIRSDKKKERWVFGSVLLMAGCLLWSSWFIIQAKIGTRYPCQYSSTTILSLFAAIQSAALGFILERNLSLWILDGELEIIGILFAGIVGSGICYVGMSWCVKHRGPVFTAAFTPLTQIFAAIFDFSILHEQIYLGSVIGSALVVLGLYILLWGKSNEAEECAVKQTQPTKTDDAESESPQASVAINLTNA